MTHTTLQTPIGLLTLAASDEGLTSVTMEDHTPAPDQSTWGDYVEKPPAGSVLESASTQLQEYFAGERREFDLPLSLVGTPFQHRVWEALRTIPYGETRSYAWIAQHIDQPTAVRAVGLANSRNKVSIVLPCHRVVSSSGKLQGYAGGVERKATLIALERTAWHNDRA